MPRLKITTEERRFRAEVKKYCDLYSITKARIAILWDVTVRCVTKRLDSPEKIPVGDILRLAKLFRIDYSELIDLIKY